MAASYPTVVACSVVVTCSMAMCRRVGVVCCCDFVIDVDVDK